MATPSVDEIGPECTRNGIKPSLLLSHVDHGLKNFPKRAEKVKALKLNFRRKVLGQTHPVTFYSKGKQHSVDQLRQNLHLLLTTDENSQTEHFYDSQNFWLDKRLNTNFKLKEI